MDFSVSNLRSRFLVPMSDDMMGTGAASAAKKIARMAVRYPAGRLPEVQPAAGQSMKIFQVLRQVRLDMTA